MAAPTGTDRNLRVVSGAALSAAIADLAEQVESGGGKGAGFALIAALWKSLPAEAVDGIVHLAAEKVGPVELSEAFAHYKHARA